MLARSHLTSGIEGRSNGDGALVGMDVSVKGKAVCVVDEASKVVCEQKVPSEPDETVTLLISIGMDYGRVGIEVGSLSQWLVTAWRKLVCP